MASKATRNKKIAVAVGVIVPVLALLLAFAIVCMVTMGVYSPAFLGRVLVHWDSSVNDYRLFDARTVSKSDLPYVYERLPLAELASVPIAYANKSLPLHEFVAQTDTTSLLIVYRDTIVYEQYAGGYDSASVNTSFSMAKSVVSLLVGRAIEAGYIHSVTDPIGRYIEEWAALPIGRVTIEELLSMRSPIAYDENKFLWFGDDSLTYWYDDLRELALQHTRLNEVNDGKFRYNNYHPLLLGIILERTTGMSVSQWFEQEIWRKIGAEFDASWSLDSAESGFEKMESGINFRAVDFIKIGSMVLHGGYWNGEQIIGEDWLRQSTYCDRPLDNDEYEDSFLADKNIGYRYMWYSFPSASEGQDVFAWGKSDQLLYISPAADIVILRTGKTDGGVSDWPNVLSNLVEVTQSLYHGLSA